MEVREGLLREGIFQRLQEASNDARRFAGRCNGLKDLMEQLK